MIHRIDGAWTSGGRWSDNFEFWNSAKSWLAVAVGHGCWPASGGSRCPQLLAVILSEQRERRTYCPLFAIAPRASLGIKNEGFPDSADCVDHSDHSVRIHRPAFNEPR